MVIEVNLNEKYGIVIERSALSRIGEIINLDRKVLVVTDSGVPKDYAAAVVSACKTPVVVTVEMGEGSKSIETYTRLLSLMLENGFTRGDAVVAVGGGVVGDLSGFVAASYMRGVDFYNVPTTLLSQVDSSVGGKTAVNLSGIKNCVGAFWQPKGVVIDPTVLKTLSPRQFNSGLAEVIKMAATLDKELFEMLEGGNFYENIDEIIARAVDIKRRVVEADEREDGLRRVLNFGHTVGHAIESEKNMTLYHGECVALGMLPMCSDAVRYRLASLLELANLPTKTDCDPDKIVFGIAHDKKLYDDKIKTVYVNEIGTFEIREERLSDFSNKVREVLS